MVNKILAFLILLIFLPLFFIIGILIYYEDGFPIFYTQKRVGINCTFFTIYKFRSMKNNTPNIPTHLFTNANQYILKIGKLIRKTSLDELPNLINVIKGEMVFVGPRPALFNQFDLIELRLATGVSTLKPGITGLAQINGRDEITIEAKVLLDQEYLNKKSFILDLVILIKTFLNVLIKKGISH